MGRVIAAAARRLPSGLKASEGDAVSKRTVVGARERTSHTRTLAPVMLDASPADHFGAEFGDGEPPAVG